MLVDNLQMSSFRDSESKRLGQYAAGQWSHAESSHPHILPPELAQQNLLDDVRATERHELWRPWLYVRAVALV